MGFCSNVYIACTEEAFKEFETAYSHHNFTPTSILRNIHGDYLLKWEWVKWYDRFEEVQAIEKVMRELDDNNKENASYKFIKIDEDDTITTEANDYGYDIFEDTYGSSEICLGSFAANESGDELLNSIARKYIPGFAERRGLDFIDISACSIKLALREAYEAGKKER